MFKDKILAELKTKFEGVDSKILDRIAEKLSKTVKNEDEVTTAVEGVTFQNVLESYGDSRANDATKTSILNYEKKYGLKNGEKVSDPAPKDDKPDDLGDDAPAWAKAILESNKTLTARIAAMEGEKITTTRKGKLDQVLEGLTDLQKKPYYRMRLDEGTDEEFDGVLDSIKEEIAEVVAGNRAKGGVFQIPKNKSGVERSGGESEEATDAEVDEILASL